MITGVDRVVLSVIDMDRRRRDLRRGAFFACLASCVLILASFISFACADSSLIHNAGNVEMIVSDWGALTEVQGDSIYPNFVYIVEDDYRYYMDPFSDVWAGDINGWVASGFDGFEGDLYFGEWQPTTPDGNAKYIPDHPNASQCIHAQYTPSRYSDFEVFPYSITVDQYTYAWDPGVYPDDGDYIMMKLILTNVGNLEVEDFYAAVQTNWDVDYLDERDDLVDWDDERRAGIAYDSDATDPMYLALALIDGKLASHNIVNYDEWEFSDFDRSDLMSNGEMDDLSTISSAPANYLNVITAGPYNIPAGKSVSVVYAFVIGEGLDGLRNNIDAARRRAIFPGKLTAEPSSDAIHLTWAESISPDVASYKVYRSSTSGSGYSEIAQVSAENAAYSDTQVQMGTTYYYVVTAIHADGRESGYSSEVNAVPGVAPPPPRNLTFDRDMATPKSAEIVLRWEPSADGNIINYKVFRNSTGSEPWTAIATVDSDVRSFIDREVYDGDTYYYAIAAINAYNWISEYSNVVSVTLDLAGPLDPAVDLEAVKVAPNPCGIAGRLRFINLPARAEIRVYTSVGKLVKTLHHIDGTGEEEWDLRNEQGAILASGIYVYYIESYKTEEHGKFTTSGKFALIK